MYDQDKGKRGRNPNWRQNLVMWKKGQSGNPNGRPKKLPKLDELLIQVLGEQAPDGTSGMLAILKTMRAEACKGDVTAAHLLIERAYGKVTQKIDLFDQRQRVAELFPKDIIDECENTEPGTFEQRQNGKADKSEFSSPNTES